MELTTEEYKEVLVNKLTAFLLQANHRENKKQVGPGELLLISYFLIFL